MINIAVRNRNLLVTLSSPAKAPIKARPGSVYFYNSMELLCVSLGACFGGEFIKWCTSNKINPATFESLQITMENFVPKIIVQYPETITDEQIDDIKYMATHCQVSKLLTDIPEIEFVKNEKPVKILVDETKRSNCCGG